MSSLASLLGLIPNPNNGSPPPAYTAGYVIFHFLFAYAGIASRPWKIYYGLDHNVSPRGDLAKYGPRAVEAKKITQERLNQMIRVESAHANSVEHFPVFVGALLWAHIANLDNTTINTFALEYTVARLVYTAAYIFVSGHRLSYLRGIAWWVSNFACVKVFWWGGKAINGV